MCEQLIRLHPHLRSIFLNLFDWTSRIFFALSFFPDQRVSRKRAYSGTSPQVHPYCDASPVELKMRDHRIEQLTLNSTPYRFNIAKSCSDFVQSLVIPHSRKQVWIHPRLPAPARIFRNRNVLSFVCAFQENDIPYQLSRICIQSVVSVSNKFSLMQTKKTTMLFFFPSCPQMIVVFHIGNRLVNSPFRMFFFEFNKWWIRFIGKKDFPEPAPRFFLLAEPESGYCRRWFALRCRSSH